MRHIADSHLPTGTTMFTKASGNSTRELQLDHLIKKLQMASFFEVSICSRAEPHLGILPILAPGAFIERIAFQTNKNI